VPTMRSSVARSGGFKNTSLRGRAKTGMEKSNAQPGALPPRSQGAVVLFGQHRCRHHEQGLTARPSSHHARSERDRGLAAAHVALQQALHGHSRRHRTKDGVDCSLLRARQREGQGIPNLRQDLP
jgi:hypothetical protein